MNEFELKQKLNYLDQMIRSAQDQIVRVTNDRNMYQKISNDIRNMKNDRSIIVNNINALFQQQQQQQQAYNSQQQQAYNPQQQQQAYNPQQQAYVPQQQNNSYNQMNHMVNNVDRTTNVASTSKYNNRPAKEQPAYEQQAFSVPEPKKPVVDPVPDIGSEFEPLMLPGVTVTKTIENGKYKNEIKEGKVLSDVESNIVTLNKKDTGDIIIDDSIDGGNSLKKYLLYSTYENKRSALAVDAVARVSYLVSKDDAGTLQDILRESDTLEELAQLLNEITVTGVTHNAVRTIDTILTNHVNHVLLNVAKVGFRVPSFIADWREVKQYKLDMNPVEVITLESNMDVAMEQLKHIDIEGDENKDYKGDNVVIENYDRPVTGLYITSPDVKETLDKLPDNEVRIINPSVSQVLYNLLEHTRNSRVNFSKTRICYTYTDTYSYVITYNKLTKYYTVVRR